MNVDKSVDVGLSQMHSFEKNVGLRDSMIHCQGVWRQLASRNVVKVGFTSICDSNFEATGIAAFPKHQHR